MQTVLKWRNSLELRIPSVLAKKARIAEGTKVYLEVSDCRLIVRPARSRVKLKQLVARITPENRHGEIDWGAVGREQP
jgi:antitoxin MazE